MLLGRPSKGAAVVDIVHGDLWEAFRADPQSVVGHGVTFNMPLDLASLLRLLTGWDQAHRSRTSERLWGRPNESMNPESGDAAELSTGRAAPHHHGCLAFVDACDQRRCPRPTALADSPTVHWKRPGGLSRDAALNSVRAGAEGCPIPIKVFLWPR